MSDWPRREDRWGLDWTLSVTHSLCLGPGYMFLANFTPAASTAWPSANRAILIPFRLPKPATVYKATVGCGATGGGNFDVGVYDEFGNRLVSSGSTARSATSEVNVDLTDTLLGQGVYYMALSADGTNTYVAQAPNLNFLKACGVRQASTAFALPSTVTFQTVASAFIPSIQLRFRSY